MTRPQRTQTENATRGLIELRSGAERAHGSAGTQAGAGTVRKRTGVWSAEKNPMPEMVMLAAPPEVCVFIGVSNVTDKATVGVAVDGVGVGGRVVGVAVVGDSVGVLVPGVGDEVGDGVGDDVGYGVGDGVGDAVVGVEVGDGVGVLVGLHVAPGALQSCATPER
jgi:hypothetical protein